MPLSCSLCLSVGLSVCAVRVYFQYVCVCIFTSVWEYRSTLSIQRHIFFVYLFDSHVGRLLLRYYHYYYRWIIFIFVVVVVFHSSFSLGLFFPFVRVYSFHCGSCWKLPFRICSFGEFFFVVISYSPMFMNLLFLCATWMTIFDWTKRMNERARTETWFESNVRIIYFGFWFRTMAT